MQLEQFIKAKVLQETIQAKIDDLRQLRNVILDDSKMVHIVFSQYPRFWECDLSGKSGKLFVEHFSKTCEETIAKLQKDFDNL